MVNVMGVPAPEHPEPRRHHYVPRCWLRGFTEDGERDGRLWVTDFSRRAQWPSSPANAGHIRDFYRLGDDAPDPVAVETFFGTLETNAAPILRSIDAERRPPSNDELDVLLEFMAYQFVRLPAFRPFVLQLQDRIVRGELERLLQTPETWRAALVAMGEDPDRPGTDFEGMRRFVEGREYSLRAETAWFMERAFTDVDTILRCLRERFWGTSITQHGRLIASDNPVMLEGERDHLVGFRNAEFVFYPLSRHVLLTGTTVRVQPPPFNFYYFARMNTMTLLRTDAQVYSHIPDFVWCDRDRNTQQDWRLFSKDNF